MLIGVNPAQWVQLAYVAARWPSIDGQDLERGRKRKTRPRGPELRGFYAFRTPRVQPALLTASPAALVSPILGFIP